MAHKTIRMREQAIDDRLNGIGICSLDLGGDPAPAPDPLIGQSAAANAQISREYLDYTKQVDAELKPARDAAIKLAMETATDQAAIAKKQGLQADDTYNYTKDTFRPIEKEIALDAMNYDTPERRAAAAAQAQADVGSALDAQRVNASREIESRGGDVNSGNFLSALARGAIVGGAAQGAAGNKARLDTEAVGAAKMADAAALGRGISSSNATTTQLGLSAGNSAVGNAQVPGSVGAQQVSTMGAGVNGAIAGNSSAGNLSLGAYNAQTNAQQAADSKSNAAIGALGSVAGSALFKFSDENIKHDREKVSDEIALDQVMNLPKTEKWKYDEGSVADDGGKEHQGHMAQDVKRIMGEEAAPGGKVISLEHMADKGLSAIRQVAKTQAKIEKRLDGLEHHIKPAKTAKKGAHHGR